MSNNETSTVKSYLATRLEQIGIRPYFAVPGNYNLILLDELLKNKNLKLIGCCNELDAGYADDGNGWSTKVSTEGELDKALMEALTNDGVSFIEVIIDRDDCSKVLLEWETTSQRITGALRGICSPSGNFERRFLMRCHETPPNTRRNAHGTLRCHA